jgi:hypothetical protein
MGLEGVDREPFQGVTTAFDNWGSSVTIVTRPRAGRPVLDSRQE